jgi:cobalt-zinc-cadmium resistance protein CzcA
VQYWFYQLQYLEHVRRKLQTLDSLYGNFVAAATLRFESGETSLLEKTTAETKKGQIVLMLQQAEREINSAYVYLQT